MTNKIEKIDTVTHHDEDTWKLYHEGRTKGVFQLESNLGKTWAKKVKPNNIEELAGLISIIRPGCLKAKIGDKTLSQIYADRKNLEEPVSYIHESLEDILKPTYGILVYQEQAMRIAQKLAGFSEADADVLRKAIGKKKADLMAKVRKDFIEGCESVGIVDAKTADEIFGWIEKSARYSFNKSHAVAYAVNSYWSAYRKVHGTKAFFAAWLQYSGKKQDPHEEVYELVTSCKMEGFEIETPKISRFEEDFHYKDGAIHFGITNVKSLTGKDGRKAFVAISEVEELLGKPPKEWTWIELLLFFSTRVNSTVFKTLCSIGFFIGIKTKITRNKALYDYGILKNLTKNELQWACDNYKLKKWTTLEGMLKDVAVPKKEGGGCSRTSRIQKIENEIKMVLNPPFSLEDDPDWIIDQEVKLLGCPVSMSRVDALDAGCGNTTCKELADGKKHNKIIIVATIARLVNFKIKKEGPSKGKEMSFMTIEDSTGVYDSVVVFPECREESKYSLYEGNNVAIHGKSEKGKDSLIVEKIMDI